MLLIAIKSLYNLDLKKIHPPKIDPPCEKSVSHLFY